MKKDLQIKPRYVLVIYDTPEERDEANKLYNEYDEDLVFIRKNVKLEAISVGQSIHGKQWRGQRPTKVIDCTVRRPINFEWWYRGVKPYLVKDCKFDKGERFDV
ncbi:MULTISPECIES: hypothetical protein [Bacteria]|uniref:hypothetical protein n=1 Tax=Bacteria TaxID=2 RepID=UPI00077A83DA|nr:MULTISPECIES: hypothetical protein [Bacteria]MCX2704667.1 hypothetical protein [Bacillus sp. AS_5]BCA37380.1 hypothetical protein BwiPL1_57620 [Bacillus wiedmannii]KAB7675483.1 hypothetical protein GBN91_27360 [Bacillus sp. B1-WWTP-T-0.5-Post-4]KXY57141.1 hypothetical protein AT278_14290 [Bacillus cereus]MBT2201202.1 hypothetical protein [Bacillus thuringiensis]